MNKDSGSIRSIAFCTGAGISAESGVPTFRDAGGLWQGRRPEEVATPEAFVRDPADVWEFYLARRRELLTKRPNKGHEAIAQAETRFATVAVITQNIDGLHRMAGSNNVIELHGSIWVRRCALCGKRERDESVELDRATLPTCPCGGLLRPDVVWFGEELPEGAMQESIRIAQSVDVLVVAGTSNAVYPAASIPLAALESGVEVIEINLQPTSLSRVASRFIQGPAAACVPALLDELAK